MEHKKVIEYGSEFDWDSNKDCITINKKELDFNQTHYFRSGRDAFNAVARKYRNKYKIVLMPALCCESMVVPFERNGYEIVYYKLNEDITANVEDILSKINEEVIFVYLNYFGIQALSNSNLKMIKSTFEKIVTIEDRTQDILVNREDNNSFVPDYTLCSVRKWLAIPDGGILYSHFTNETFDKAKDTYFSTIRKKALKKKSNYIMTGEIEFKDQYRTDFQEANEYLNNDIKIVEIDNESLELLQAIEFEKIANIRMVNVRNLIRHIGNIKGIRNICESDKQSNLYYPILVENRDGIQRDLAKMNIYCPVIWPLPQGAEGICEVSEYISKHILALPCDQRYKDEDIDYICNVLKSLMEEK